jgi:hypothetical protein
MGGPQRRRRRANDRQRVVQRQPPDPLQARAQRLPLDELGHQVGQPVGQAAAGEQVDDARVMELARRPRLVQEAVDRRLVLADRPAQHPDRRPAAVLGMLREIHPAERVLAGQVADFEIVDVLSDQRSPVPPPPTKDVVTQPHMQPGYTGGRFTHNPRLPWPIVQDSRTGAPPPAAEVSAIGAAAWIARAGGLP